MQRTDEKCIYWLGTAVKAARQLLKEDLILDITNKMLADLAGQLGIDTADGGKAGAGTKSNAGMQIGTNEMKRIAEQYKDKSDSEILSEISKVKEKIKKDRKLYEQQLKAVQALRPMMNAEQRARLDKIIALLKS